MVVQAAADEPGFLASDIEMGEDEPSYTVATLERLRAKGVAGASLFVILGADAFRDLPTWKAYPGFLDRSHFVVVSRPGLAASQAPVLVPALASRMHETPCAVTPDPGIFLVSAATMAVSSTIVRRAAAAGESIEAFVPPAVARHIARYGLYRD